MRFAIALIGLLLFSGLDGAAAQRLTIGVVTTLSGPRGAEGRDILDGFLLAVSEESGRLGGVPVEIVAEGDTGTADGAANVAGRMIKTERATILTGAVTADLAAAAAEAATKAKRFYLAPAEAPAAFAGEKCHGDYFAIGWRVDAPFEMAGLDANRRRLATAAILATAGEAGTEAAEAFARGFKGRIVARIAVPDDAADFSAQLAGLKAAAPEAIVLALPDGLAQGFLKQLDAAGWGNDDPTLLHRVAPALRELFSLPEPPERNPLAAIYVSAMNSGLIAAAGAPARKLRAASIFKPGEASEAWRNFGARFEAKYGREPTQYAGLGFDSARLVASALKATGGKVLSDRDGFRAALLRAKFASLRGGFRFASNHYAAATWYVTRRPGEKPADEPPALLGIGSDPHAGKCPLG